MNPPPFPKKTGIIDLHVDSIIIQRFFRYDIRKKHLLGLRGQPFFGHADLPRMQETGYTGACLGIHYWPWESEKAWRELERQIDYLDKICQHSPNVYRVYSPTDWQKAQEKQLLALAPGVEGTHMLNGDLSRVEHLAQRGVSYLTLTHFSKNRAATPSIGRGANEREGLSPFGRELVQLLNEFSIIIDVAHVNTPGVLEVCQLSQSPILCTHTGVKGIHPAARNISDAEIDAIAANGGVIGVIFAPFFLKGKLWASSECIAEHIEYIAERVGTKHIALGSDYDGFVPSIPNDQRDCRGVLVLREILERKGFSAEDLQAIFQENALRVLSGG